jgi:Fe-S cluster assembly protein SufD
MASTTASRPVWLDRFAERAAAATGPDWVRALRRTALRRFDALGLPGPRDEKWRTTNVGPIADTEFAPAARSETPQIDDRMPAVARVDLGGPRLVFVDGLLVDELSTRGVATDGVWVGSLAHALATIPQRVRPLLTRRAPDGLEAFDALNAALTEDGAVVLADAGAEAGPPVQLVYVTTGDRGATASHPRTIVAADRRARLQVVETHAGLDGEVYFTNAVTDVVAGDDARIDHCRIQLEGPAAYHVSNLHSRQGRDSCITLHNLNVGGRLVRHDVVSVLDGEGANCQLNGLYVTGEEQHVDNHTVLDHARPHGSSRELYKGVLGGTSRAVFNGRIIVRPDAQKTDAKQSNPNLILSRGALAHTRPQLEIYADDVKCTHGATVGRLDDEALFYLRSRGLSGTDARNLMIASFAGEVVERLELPALRQEVERLLAARLPQVAL